MAGKIHISLSHRETNCRQEIEKLVAEGISNKCRVLLWHTLLKEAEELRKPGVKRFLAQLRVSEFSADGAYERKR